MDSSTEINCKIQNAIKGELPKLGVYVDEELPDYIMVMVAREARWCSENRAPHLVSGRPEFKSSLRHLLAG
uniref:Uncharacterized protein n=1 Tax=Vombatus ursinus TaxID=29139 RepID=A0A4X2KVU0_VOMUR